MKKLICATLAAAMALSLAACGSSDSTAAAGSTADSTTATAEGASAPIKLGGIGPTTGNTAQYGVAVQQGEELAVQEIN